MRCLERNGRVSTIAKDSGPTQLSVAEKTWQIVEDLLVALFYRGGESVTDCGPYGLPSCSSD